MFGPHLWNAAGLAHSSLPAVHFGPAAGDMDDWQTAKPRARVRKQANGHPEQQQQQPPSGPPGKAAMAGAASAGSADWAPAGARQTAEVDGQCLHCTQNHKCVSPNPTFQWKLSHVLKHVCRHEHI